MSDQTYIWILIFVLMVLVLVGGALIGRRFRVSAKDDHKLRYTRLRGVCILYGIVVGLQLFAAAHGHEASLWKKYLASVAMGFCFIFFLFQCLQARKKWRTTAEFKRMIPQKSAPFFWQAAFIMLPVVLLAGFGLYSLRQDRVLAEQEAREAGVILAQRVAQAIATEGVQQLCDYRNVSFSLAANRSADLGLSSWSGGAVTESNEWQRIKAWQQANPEMDIYTLPSTDRNAYNADRPLAMPPIPPKWLAELDSEQQQLWQMLKQAGLSGQDDLTVSNLVERFVTTNPPKGARANAHYLLLLSRAKSLSASDAVSRITEYSRAHWGSSSELSDAGLPLGQLICCQALRLLSNGASLPENFIRHHTVAWMINYDPSVFSPVLIAETERVARGASQEQFAATLKAWWNANAAARQVMDDFREQYPTNIWSPAPFWVDSSIGKFLLMLGERGAVSTNSPPPQTAYYDYLLFPQAVVEKSFVKAAGKSGISLPSYALVEVEMAGRTIPISSGQNAGAKTNHFAILGQAGGVLKDLPLNQHAYPFRIRVSLASPGILYARQSLRTWLFGSIILLSFGAAVVALLAARRAFLRQLALNEQKSNFVSSVSHELRAPIASVRLMAENLERGKISGAEKQTEYFRFIVQECRRLSSLIENVLDFSRIEQGRKQYEFEPTDLVALTQTTVKLMEPYAEEKGVALEFKAESGKRKAELDLDGRAIQQALVNLIDNAIKHSAKGQTVTVGLGIKNDSDALAINYQLSTINLSVSDHGPGIPASEHDKIFERFYRLGSELRRETQGVGIGLSVVKHIVEAHGGRVVVKSEVGQGSRFTIELPSKSLTTDGHG